MGWIRRSKVAVGGGHHQAAEMRERLVPAASEKAAAAAAAAVPRGCVALLLEDDGGCGGCGGGGVERMVVEVRVLALPRVRALLEMAAREFGYDQKGVLRVPCSADEFRRALAADGSAGASCRCRR